MLKLVPLCHKKLIPSGGKSGVQAGQSSISDDFPSYKPSLSKHIQAKIGWFCELGELLRWLDLAQNRLEGMTGGFSFGAQLEVLNLSSNQLGELWPGTFQTLGF